MLSCVWIVKYANVLICAGGECLFCFSISRWGAEQIGQVMNFSSHLHFFVVLTRVCVRWGGASLAKCRTGSGEEADHMSFSVHHRPTTAGVDGGAESKCCCALEKIQYIMLLNAPFLSFPFVVLVALEEPTALRNLQTCCYQLVSANSANNNNGSGHLAFPTCSLISNVTSFRIRREISSPARACWGITEAPSCPKGTNCNRCSMLCLWAVYWITFKKNEWFSLIKILDWDQNKTGLYNCKNC